MPTVVRDASSCRALENSSACPQLGKGAGSSHDRAMALNLDATPLASFFERRAAHLLTVFATLPPSAQQWLDTLLPRARGALASDGRVAAWQRALAALPNLTVETQELAATLRAAGPCDAITRGLLHDALAALGPWRKGPFELFGVHIDAEWRSDWKWARVAPHLTALAGRRVLDVGCGNGYYLWRLAEAGASLVLGLDPALASYSQFAAISVYLRAPQVYMLTLASADLDARLAVFDTVFSMGVLYHRRDAHAHLMQLRHALRDGGELLLETLVIADDGDEVLIPATRYAAMRNVWAIPAPRTVMRWLQAAGFSAVRMVDITATSVAEQRSSAWMPHHSLAAFVDAQDQTLTIEGYPAPLRAVFVARAQ